MGLLEAFDRLVHEFEGAVGSLSFLPDYEMKESSYYPNLIEILETIFNIVKSEKVKNDAFFLKIDQIFKKTKNEDLRFTLIKLLVALGDRYDYFMKYFDDFTEKERRALYYIYSIIEHPNRLEIFRRGFGDEKNFDYVVVNLLNFPEGRIFLSNELLAMGNFNKQTVLKKLRDGKHPEFIDVLTKLLNDKNKFLVEIAIEILKNNISSEASLKPFITMAETGYSPEGISGALEIIAHCVKYHPEDIYLQALEQQPSARNKNLILEFLIEQFKGKIRPSDELTEKILHKLLSFFENHTKDKEDLYLSIFKIIPSLYYSNANILRAVKKKIIGFKKDFENRFSAPFKNNLSEFIVKLNQLASRFEESETKMKNVVILFDIDPLKIEHPRIMKFKEQLQELENVDDTFKERLEQFLVALVDTPRVDWKIRSVAIELLGDYGGKRQIGKLNEIAEKDTSLAIKVNAQKSAKKIEERLAAHIENVVVMEPLPYIQKKINDFFKSHSFRVCVVNEVERFEEICAAPFRFLVISESLLTDDDFTRQVFDYLDEHFDATLVIVTANPELLDQFQDIPNVRFLKKPFNDEMLNEIITAG